MSCRRRRFCKCKACTFCGGSAAPPSLSPRGSRSPPPPRWPKKGKKGRRSAESGEKAVAVAAAGEAPKGTKTKCESGLKGDLPFLSCASFCKGTKAGNHCKFCKCRTCSYCTAAGTPTEAAAASIAAAKAAESPPSSSLGGATVGDSAAALASTSPPQRGVPIDTATKTGASHMRLFQGLGVAVLLVMLGFGLVAFTSQGDATMGSWRYTLQQHLEKMGLSDHGREGVRLNREESTGNDLDAAFAQVDKLEADIGSKR